MRALAAFSALGLLASMSPASAMCGGGSMGCPCCRGMAMMGGGMMGGNDAHKGMEMPKQ